MFIVQTCCLLVVYFGPHKNNADDRPGPTRENGHDPKFFKTFQVIFFKSVKIALKWLRV